MSAIHERSHPIVPPELDTQSIPPTQVAIESVIESVLRPIAKVGTNKPILFEIFVPSGQALRLWETEMHLKVKITAKNANGTAHADYDKVGIANNFAHSIFNHITMELNGKPITAMPTTYPYRAYLDTLFGFTDESKESWLVSSGWFDESSETEIASCLGSSKKTNFYNVEKELIMRPHLDLMMQNKCLHGGSLLRLNFYPQNENFYLKKLDSTVNISLELIDAYLRLNFNKLSEGYVKRFRHPSQTDRYFIKRIEVKEHNIPANTTNFIIDRLTSGQVPNVMIIGFVDNDAYIGSLRKNPFNFNHHNICSLALYKNGILVNNEDYKPDFADNKCLREYDDLFKTVNHSFTDSHFPLTFEKFTKGNTFFAFNLTRDKQPLYSDAPFINVIDKAETRLDIRFTASTTKTITCLVYSEYNNYIEMNSNGNVTTDYM